MTRSRRLLLLLNGELGNRAAVRRAARECGSVVCADGGARHAAALGIEPRVILGDMDSLPARRPAWPDTAYLCDFDADRSDFDKALRFAAERDFEEVWVAGGMGGAPDHLLVNLALAERFAASFDIRLIGEPEARVLGPGRHRLPARKGRRVTLLSIPERSRVSTRGLRYPLRSQWLQRGSRGLSNVATASPATVIVHRGRVWAIF